MTHLVAVAVLALLYAVLAFVKTSFRFLHPVAAERLIEKKGLREESSLRQSLRHPLPVWYTLQIASLVTLAAITALLASSPLIRAAGGQLVSVLAGIGGAALLALFVEYVGASLLVRGREEAVLAALFPVVRLLHGILAPLSRLLAGLIARTGEEGAEAEASREEQFEEEIRAYIDAGEREGILEEEEGELLEGILEAGDSVAREVMTPRTDILAIRADATLEELRRLMVEGKHTRVPLYRESLDAIEGVVHVKDVLEAMEEGNGSRAISEIARPAYFVPETKKVLDLLRELQESRASIAIVVDEYGGTAGLVTIEDLLEEIVGEIQDEHEPVRLTLVRERDGSLVVEGRTPLDELEEVLERELPHTEEVDTVGGLVCSACGHVPAAGEEVESGGLRFWILEADEKRVHRIRVQPIETVEEPS
jgi:magnesium and cobalt transporter